MAIRLTAQRSRPLDAMGVRNGNGNALVSGSGVCTGMQKLPRPVRSGWIADTYEKHAGQPPGGQDARTNPAKGSNLTASPRLPGPPRTYLPV